MNLLTEGISQQAVIKTELTRKLTVDGLTTAYPVYKIKLDWLFYNDQNDRIATWISRYKADHDGKMPDVGDKTKYNDIIEQFIAESNPDALKKTQTNIELTDQREPGVVLSDGRIIDGNRRFTCLRRLASKNDRFGYFEAVILNHNIENNAKQIKMLELAIQHGEESKVGYDPIDRLVGIYTDITETHLLSVQEYAKSTNESLTEIKKRVEIADLMIEFLEFINAPKQYYIARDLAIYYPLEELLKLIKKCRTEDEAEDLKNSVYTNILMNTAGDMTRFIRKIQTIIGSDHQNEFLNEQREIAEKVIETLPESEMNVQTIREVVRSNHEIVEELKRSMEKADTKAKKTETHNRPIALAEKATTFLESMDTAILLKLNDSEIRRLERQLDRLESVIAQIRESL